MNKPDYGHIPTNSIMDAMNFDSSDQAMQNTMSMLSDDDDISKLSQISSSQSVMAIVRPTTV